MNQKNVDAQEEQAWATYAGRLAWAMRHAGKTNQSELARTIGVKPQSIQYLCDPQGGAQGSSHTPSLARELGVQADWLATGRGRPVEGMPLRLQERAAPGYAVREPVSLPIEATLKLLSVAGEVQWLDRDAAVGTLGMLALPVWVEGARAVRIKGDALLPFLKDGQCLLLKKHQPLLPEDTVLIGLKDGRTLIREVMVVRDDGLLLLPVHGGQAETFHHDDIKTVDLIVCVLPRRWWLS